MRGVEDAEQFRLLGDDFHDSCRGDVFIPSGSVVSVSELYLGLAGVGRSLTAVTPLGHPP